MTSLDQTVDPTFVQSHMWGGRCEHFPDPESFDPCNGKATVKFRVHDPHYDHTWWSYACTVEHAAGVINELREQGYVLLPKED